MRETVKVAALSAAAVTNVIEIDPERKLMVLRFRLMVAFSLDVVKLRPCQRKVEMTPSPQSRNVAFSTRSLRVRVDLLVPVKRRRALVSTNPIKG